jgi:hypothetical protein
VIPALSDEEIEALSELVESRTSMMPGDGDPEDHIVEQLAPTKGVIRRQMEQAREGHRVAEEDPERGAYHGGAPIPDMGGITMPADPRNLTGPFVPVPPDQVRPPMTGGRKMRVQSFAEAQAEIAEGRAEIAREKAAQARKMVSHARELAEREAALLEREAEMAEREARAAKRDAEPSGF